MRKKVIPSLTLTRKRERKAKNRRRRHSLLLLKINRRQEKREEWLYHFLTKDGEEVEMLIAPEYFGLSQESSRTPLVQFLRRLVELTLIENRYVCIDFSGTRKFYSDGMILFYAELKRIFRLRPGCVRCFLPREPVALQVLCHLGVSRLLGKNKVAKSKRGDVVHWQAVEGMNADATKGLGAAIEELPRLSRNQISVLFRSVSEALTNVTQHAYVEPRQDGTGHLTAGGWWMFVREERKELTIMFCDLGIGVPYTVRQFPKHASWLGERLSKVASAFGIHTHNDGETIQVTVEEKRSRFVAEHRGNGFGNMMETIAAAGKGTMLIHSNSGSYRYERRDQEEVHKAYNYADSIYGTVVGWHIKLQAESDE